MLGVFETGSARSIPHIDNHSNFEQIISHTKAKAISLQAWTGPEGSRRLRLPDFKTIAHESDKVVILTHRPPLPPRKYSWYSFLLGAVVVCCSVEVSATS